VHLRSVDPAGTASARQKAEGPPARTPRDQLSAPKLLRGMERRSGQPTRRYRRLGSVAGDAWTLNETKLTDGYSFATDGWHYVRYDEPTTAGDADRRIRDRDNGREWVSGDALDHAHNPSALHPPTWLLN
jgi:hypothetical protein